MGIPALNWAFEQTVGSSSLKFLLVAMANYADEYGICYPSVIRLSVDTEQDRKTIMRNIAKLEELNLLVDTNERCGATKRVPVYRLLISEAKKGNSPKNGTVDGVMVPFFPTNGPVFPSKQSLKRDTDPSGTIRNPQVGGISAAQPSKNKLTPQQLFWMINERLKTAKGSLKTKLESERDLCLHAASGIDLTVLPPKSAEPTLTVLPDPPTAEEWKAGIDALKAVVEEARTPVVNKPVLREIRFKRKLKA